ncbi:UDP-3-O-(3-hydroxymyristoyl)glucosamine N-acyltransferase [Granulicella tundricola]|uniref:UDP-3-O-(3-hydroxymyristoyl) glucosamine N-acyltransferase n=1 Tax=Granulicella tundricola (strain ATCC BAA-1859 / DSM 23138 / MP5ACTX9) TaxID=1198114 RepID=E8WWG2_GRATM|nr:UDP-3-O-(3-hydroxymyristoyl)glucosamine N-acyltransferase [Granulicella tundricola]ADW69626.1 UDP-3-O-(3-hydroxymyristoyl) glucosamine N-acyltransferase [Granulicella tundricola MP5ACTX9]
MTQDDDLSPYPTYSDIRVLLCLPLPESEEGPGPLRVFTRVSSLENAQDDSIVFATDESALQQALGSAAGLILAPLASTADENEDRVIRVKDPRLAFARVYQRWFAARPTPGVHASAVVGAEAVIGQGTSVGAGAVVEDGAQVGADCQIGPRVVILAGTTLGDRVKVKAGAVLGSSGFGFARDRSGYIGFPQIGTLVIEDDVEIGANSTIDRGALGETRIERGAKIDNLVHIAHNCRIGQDVIIAAQVGMAGSTTIEDNAMLGGQAGLGEHVTIGRGVILGGQGGVLPGKRIDGEGEIFWGTPAQPVREYLRNLARMRKR